MGGLVDLTGKVFDRLTVIKRAEDHIRSNGRHVVQWLCKCNCENKTEIIVTGDSLKGGKTRSCGCIQKEFAKTLKEINKKSNVFDLTNKEYGIGYTSKGEPFYFDTEDYNKIKDFCWFIDSNGYVVARIRNTQKYAKLHRVILDCKGNAQIDHIHGKNTRNDNRKSNLRICTRSQNGMNRGLLPNNTSGVTGVTWHKRKNKWTAQITINHKQISLGAFINFDDAVKARKQAEEKYFGEWSYDNSVKEII